MTGPAAARFSPAGARRLTAVGAAGASLLGLITDFRRPSPATEPGQSPWTAGRSPAARRYERSGRCLMAKYHSRPSAQYRYEHYDPR